MHNPASRIKISAQLGHTTEFRFATGPGASPLVHWCIDSKVLMGTYITRTDLAYEALVHNVTDTYFHNYPVPNAD